MDLPHITTITRYKFGWPLLVLLGGITFGFVMIYLISKFTVTYAMFLSLVLIFPFTIIIVGNSKRLLWAILICFLPITVDITIGHTGHASGTGGYIISAFDMVLLVLYLLWLVEIVTKKTTITFFITISTPAFALIGMALLSMTIAPFANLSWFESIEILKMYLAFFYIANNIRNKSDVQYVTLLLLAGLLFEGILGFAQHRFSEPFFPTALGGPAWIDSRVKGTWVSYNDFAWYLTFLLPLAISMLFSRIHFIYKIACFITLGFGLGSLMWTNTRSGWISFAIVAVFVVLFVFCKRRGKIAVIRFFISIVALTILATPLYPRLGAKIYGRFTGNDRGSADSRLPQFEVAYNIIMANPLLGIGINNYTMVMADYDTTEEGLPSLTRHQVHNIFLQIAAEMGVFGLIAFIWFILAIFHEGIRYIFLYNGGFKPYVVIGLLGGIMAFLIHGFYDSASLGSKLFMFIWVFGGIIVAIKKYEPDARFITN